jgi:anthranilate synthase component I
VTWQGITAQFAAGDTIQRHERLLPGAVDPVNAAAALRGVDRIMLSCKANELGEVVLAVGELAVCRCGGAPGHSSGADPLTAAIDFLAAVEFPRAGSPDERCWWGFVGYDAIRDFERLPTRAGGRLPAYELFLPEVLVRIGLRGATIVGRGATAAAAEHAAAVAENALSGANRPSFCPARGGLARFSLDYGDYVTAVGRARDHIINGEIFQVVLSVGCTAPVTADGLAVYAELSALNPSPFQFWYRGPEFEAVGASPEPCVILGDGAILVRPLAGTRPRGPGAEADRVREHELRSSEKELAEHRMLVDLARNDLGRVCQPGSIRVPRLMGIERYSHVMHLTSDVVGQLRVDSRADDAIRATFPAGTMTGAPKVRAMEIIDELEPIGRGLYSGAVGSIGIDRVDLYLTIRSLVLQADQVWLQAGGGIVYDSDPQAEREECVAKLRVCADVVGLDLRGATS